MVFQTATVGRLCSLFSQGPEPIFLLGAGASVKSGIPLSHDMVEKIARWGYCLDNGLEPKDPRPRRSDWYPWLRRQKWYREDWELVAHYPAAVENTLRPRQTRKDFFLDILKTQVEPSSGYKHLAELMAREHVRTVLTTNFDTILQDVCKANKRPHHIEVIQTTSDYTKLSTSLPYPQLVYLHGSVEHYTDKNTIAEINEGLHPDLVSKVMPLLRDHPLIVVGYRGAEPSIMKHLLIDNAVEAEGYRHGIYWCARNYTEDSDSLTPFVHELAGEIQANFQVVPIDGFDEVMEDLWHHVQQQVQDYHQPQVHAVTEESPLLPYDFKKLTNATLDDFDWPPMRVRLLQYCQTTGLQTPPVGVRNDDWFTQLLCNQHLASRTEEGNTFPTVGGYLLFAETPQHQIQTAEVVVRLKGEAKWLESVFDISEGETEQIIVGNLWAQLEEIYALFSRVNRGFILKGGRHSKNVSPYPPDALREIVVNALVHRDYEKDAPILIEIEQTCIRVHNPGGLVQDVVDQMRGTPQEEIKSAFETKIKGGNSIQGYRNPVVADLFYGAAEMEKAGSGLSKVWQASEENNNEVRFGPVDNNAAFEITISRRPEVVDDTTGTAYREDDFDRYASNLLEVRSFPEVVWHAGTDARTVKEVWEKTGADWLPPFMLYAERLFTFDMLSTPANLLYPIIDANDIAKMTVDEFIDVHGEQRFVWLLNTCFFRHLEAKGLWIDKTRKRAYFPKTDENAREVTYQARVRRATRKVVKKRKNYWEHKSFWFRFERFGDFWALVLLPSYVFTTDGKGALSPGDLVNKFSNTRQSRDYNNVVHNDLVFWTQVLSGGKQGTFTLNIGPADTSAANQIHQLDRPQIRITANLSATEGLDSKADAYGIENSEKLDTTQLEAEFSQVVPQLAEEEDVNSDGT